jgi:hypothetical protein
VKLGYIALQIAPAELMQRGELFGTQRGTESISHPATMLPIVLQDRQPRVEPVPAPSAFQAEQILCLRCSLGGRTWGEILRQAARRVKKTRGKKRTLKRDKADMTRAVTS